jgi:hypothetical protein
MPRYGGFCTAAEFLRVQKKEQYIRWLLGKDEPKMTELPIVEPYYSRCLEEYRAMAKSNPPQQQLKISTTKAKPNKRTRTYKNSHKSNSSRSNHAPSAPRKVTPLPVPKTTKSSPSA